MKARNPKNEAKRLEILWQYDVLDTVPEEMFDELTDLAASICAAPIAMISLVDEDRQWFKSCIGTSLKETSRDISFCAHAILQDGLLEVSDASKDPRFANNPLVTTRPKIRFYAGAPLVTPDGHSLGTLCVMDKKSRKLTSDQRQALATLARHVMTQLELRRHAKELKEARAESASTRAKLGRAHAEIDRLRHELGRYKSASFPVPRRPSRRP